MAPDQVPSSERHVPVSPQLVLECLKEAKVDGFFPDYFDREGRNSFCSASKYMLDLSFLLYLWTFAWVSPPCLECLFLTL